MNHEYYNPYSSEEQSIIDSDEQSRETAAEEMAASTADEPKRGFFGRLLYSIRAAHPVKIFCIILGLCGISMLVAFISYIKDAAIDQSAVLNNSAFDIARNGFDIKNLVGALGASVSELFINRWIGIGAFIVPVWMLIVCVKAMSPSKVKINMLNTTIVSLLALILLTLAGGYITLHSVSVISYGGNLGREVSRFLIGYVGDFGTFVIYAGLLLMLLVFCMGTIVKVISGIMKLFPAREHKKLQPVDEDDEVNNYAPVKAGASASSQASPIDFELATDNESDSPSCDVKDENEQEEEEDKLLFSEGLVAADEKTDLPDGTITEAPPLEKADKILEPYDPTDDLPHYKFPTMDLLKIRTAKAHSVDYEEQEANKRRITEVLGNYGVGIKTINACIGPTVTLFEIVPADGVKIAKIKNLENDIALSIAALGIRIIAPIPGKGTIGIEVPNREPQVVSMRSVLESKAYQESKAILPMALGCTISNEVFVADLCKMPHLLVAGATGQGKSVGLNAIITSLIYRKHPAELKFVLFDPKMVEFSLYERLQHHYLAKLPGDDPIIITDSSKAIATLNSLVMLMEQRYLLLKEANVRNIELYNKKFTSRYLNPEKGHHFMPYIVAIIDEFADFIAVAGKDVENPISRIAAKARAVGIHMIIATQRPSANVITGKIKANFPGRMSFRVSSMVDSRTIIDSSGAQHLVGKGDMLFTGGQELIRIQCAYMDDDETIKLCDFIDEQVGYAEPFELPEYIPPTEGGYDGSSGGGGGLADRDPLLPEVAEFISGMDKASTSAIQRHFRIGYNRAGSIMDQLEALGIVGPSSGGKPRQVLVDPSQLSQMI